jgi:hypothetical protein
MPKLHALSLLTLSALLLSPSGTVLAQDDEADPSPVSAVAAPLVDPRLGDLVGLLPQALLGLPLGAELRLVTGEGLAAGLPPGELAVIEALLEAEDKTLADYAAASTRLRPSDTQVVFIEAHRLAGVDAARTIDAWVEIYSMNVTDPRVVEGFVGGREVKLMTDAADERVPTLHLFPADDVAWMMWASEQALVDGAIEELEAGPPTDTMGPADQGTGDADPGA